MTGQIKADGGDQQKFDDGMRVLRKSGKQVWPSPDVMEKMGAKASMALLLFGVFVQQVCVCVWGRGSYGRYV